MKKVAVIPFVIMLAATFNSCKKDNTSQGGYIPISYSNKIYITNLQTTNDSVTLTWSKLNNNKFHAYMVIRRNYKSTNPNTFSYNDIIEEIYDNQVVKFTDHSVPLTSYLEYQLVGALVDSVNPYYSYIFSNIMSFERPNLKTFYFNPTDLIPDIPNHRFYVIEADSGKISIVDYISKSIVNSIKTFSTNGYCDLGTFNGVKELYVPRNDGWVFIYNAETLEKIDQINAGTSCGSVMYNNGKLFIFTNSSYYYTDLYVIDRPTKAVLSSFNSLDYMRPKLVPGSNTKFFGVTSSYASSGDLYYFEFDANGNEVNQNSHYSSSPSDYHSFEVFPDGQHFITSKYGTIYASDLTYVVQLPYGSYEYSAFAFDPSSSGILAACRNYKSIVAYTNPGYTEQKTYHTVGYPAFIFNDNNTIISLSSSTNYSSYGHDFIIESIPLNKSNR